MKWTIGIILGAIIIVGGGALLLGSAPGQEENTAATKTPAPQTPPTKDTVPDLTLVDQDTGAPVALTSFKGTPAVINSWATWCPFCVQEIPDFEATQEKFQDKVSIVLVNRKEGKPSILSFLKKRGIPKDSPLTFLLDAKDAYYRAIGGFSMPETLFVNPDGTVAFHKRGVMDLAEMQELTQKLIDGTL